MGRFFNYESPIMQWLQKVACVIFCGFFWVLLCIPLITAGASTTAMFRAMFNLREEKDAGVRVFFRIFAREFRKSTLLCLLQILSGLILGIIFRLLLQIDSGTAGQIIIMMFFILLIGCWLFTFAFVYPLTAYFDNTVLHTIKNGLLMAVRHRFQAVPIVALKMLPLIVGFFCFFLSWPLFYYLIICILPVWIFAVIPLLAYVQSGLFLRIFEQYVPEEDGTETADAEGNAASEAGPAPGSKLPEMLTGADAAGARDAEALSK